MRLRNKKIASVVLFVLLSALASTMITTTVACNRVHVVNAPPGVIDTEVAAWYQATGAVKVWSDTGLQLTQTAISLHSQFPNEDMYQKTLAGLGKISQVGLQATSFLGKVPQHFDSTSQSQLGNYLDQALAMLDDATQSGLDQVKDPTMKQTVDTLITVLRSSLKTIFALTKPAGTPLPGGLK